MKNLYVTIATLLFLNFMTISAIEETHHDKAIAYLSEKWQLNNLQPFTYPSVFNNYIARAYSHRYQHDVVLKICESHDERKALQYLQCDGIVHLLDYDHEHCALLLQHVPSRGCMTDFFLEQDDDDLVINAFVHLFKKIHKSQKILASTNDFKTIHDNFAELRSSTSIQLMLRASINKNV